MNIFPVLACSNIICIYTNSSALIFHPACSDLTQLGQGLEVTCSSGFIVSKKGVLAEGTSRLNQVEFFLLDLGGAGREP